MNRAPHGDVEKAVVVEDRRGIEGDIERQGSLLSPIPRQPVIKLKRVACGPFSFYVERMPDGVELESVRLASF